LVVIESLEDEATGLVTVQTSSPSGSGPATGSTSAQSSVTLSGSASASEPTQVSLSLPGGSGTAVTATTNAAPRATGVIGRDMLFGAAGAIGAGIFGL
jgi:hypothetical protein